MDRAIYLSNLEDYMPNKGVTARFFQNLDKRRPDGSPVTMVELTVIAGKDTNFQQVTAQHIADYPEAWKAFSDGAEVIDYGGTPLTEVPGINGQVAMNYKLNGVHNAEMLADIPDIACRNLGMGAMAARNAAKNLIKAKQADASEKAAAEAEQKVADLTARLAALEGKPAAGKPAKSAAA